jgi:hypothetical protein
MQVERKIPALAAKISLILQTGLRSRSTDLRGVVDRILPLA